MTILKGMLIASMCFATANVFAQNSSAADRGKTVFEQNCLPCHQADGSGVPSLAPPLIKGTFVSGDKSRLINIVLNGLEGVEIKGEHYAAPMPAFNFLSDAEIAAVLTYVRSNFKNNAEAISEVDVKETRNTKSK